MFLNCDRSVVIRLTLTLQQNPGKNGRFDVAFPR